MTFAFVLSNYIRLKPSSERTTQLVLEVSNNTGKTTRTRTGDRKHEWNNEVLTRFIIQPRAIFLILSTRNAPIKLKSKFVAGKILLIISISRNFDKKKTYFTATFQGHFPKLPKKTPPPYKLLRVLKKWVNGTVCGLSNSLIWFSPFKYALTGRSTKCQMKWEKN